jgi:hypothetical protein
LAALALIVLAVLAAVLLRGGLFAGQLVLAAAGHEAEADPRDGDDRRPVAGDDRLADDGVDVHHVADALHRGAHKALNRMLFHVLILPEITSCAHASAASIICPGLTETIPRNRTRSGPVEKSGKTRTWPSVSVRTAPEISAVAAASPAHSAKSP